MVDLIRGSSMCGAAKLLNNRRARQSPSTDGCQNKSPGQGCNTMANTAKKISNAAMQVVKNDEPAAQAASPEPAQQPEPQPELSLEQRISMVEDLTMLIDKWRKLQESYRNLQSFKIGTDGMSTQILLRDTISGREFKTSNTAVVTRILDEIRSTLQAKILEVESQIRF